MSFEREKPHLGELPLYAFDTSYRAYRKVGKDCTVHFEGNRYVVPHRYVRKKVVIRVKEKKLRILADEKLVVSYGKPEGKGHLVQDPQFYEDLKKDREMNRRKYSHGRTGKGRAKQTISPTRVLYEMDVDVRPLETYTRFVEGM